MADATKIGVADATKMGVANARVANATQPFLGQIQWKNEFSKRIEQGYTDQGEGGLTLWKVNQSIITFIQLSDMIWFSNRWQTNPTAEQQTNIFKFLSKEDRL